MRVLLALSLFLLIAPQAAQATMYAPGATLDPACAPTDANCGVQSNTAVGTLGQVPYYAAAGNLLAATSTMTILSNGNVGIGTVTPLAKLTVTGGNISQTISSNPILAATLTDNTNLSTPAAIAVVGNYAYVVGANSFTVVDVTTPQSPKVVGTVTNSTDIGSGDIASIFVAGNYAYIGTIGVNRLTIIDISNPSAPTIISSLQSASFGLTDPNAVYVSGKYAYVSAGRGVGELVVVDVSNPSSPVVVGSASFGIALGYAFANSIYVQGRYAYVGVGFAGAQAFLVYDISVPSAPVRTGSVALPTSSGDLPVSLDVDGRYAYVGGDFNTIWVIDVSIPSLPTIVTDTLTPTVQCARSIRKSGSYLYGVSYFGTPAGGICTYTAADPTVAPIQVGYTAPPSGISGFGLTSLAVSGHYAFTLSNNHNQLVIYDLTGTELPSASIGDLQTSNLHVLNNADVYNNLYVQGGLNVGLGGFSSMGPAGISFMGAGSNILSVTAATSSKSTGKTSSFDAFILQNFATSSTASISKSGINISSTGSWTGAGASNIGLYVSSVTGGTNNYDAIFNGGGNVGIGTTGPLSKLAINGGLHVGGDSDAGDNNLLVDGNTTIGMGTPSAIDVGLRIVRNVTGALNLDNIRDESVFTGTSGIPQFASFDAAATAAGTLLYDHVAAFQDRQNVTSTGGVTELRGFYSSPTVGAGSSVYNRMGVYILDVSGAGTVTNNYGIYVYPQQKGSALNYSIYTAGGAPSYFGGTLTDAGNIIGLGTYINASTGSLLAGGASDYTNYKLDVLGNAHVAGGYLYANGSGVSLIVSETAKFRGNISNDLATYLTIAGGTSGYTYFSGNVGIGTTTPYSRLTIWGPDALAGTAAFTIANSASTTEFQVFDNGSATLAGTLTQNSDERLKQNITSLDGSSTLAAIASLNPVSFIWRDPSQGSTTQLGFIAQDVQKIFPQLVSTTSATALTPGGTLGINYIGLISPLIEAVKELAGKVSGFAQSITTAVLNATTINVKNLCLTDSSGSTCYTRSQLNSLLNQGGQQSNFVTNTLSNSNPITITDVPPADISTTTTDSTATTTNDTQATTTPDTASTTPAE